MTGKSAATMTATRPVEAPGTGSRDGNAVDRSLTSTRTVTDNTGVSDTED